jgi:hypothetical protein
VEGVTFTETLQQLRASLANRYLEDERLPPPYRLADERLEPDGVIGYGMARLHRVNIERSRKRARVRPEPSPTGLDRYLADDVHQIVFLVAAAVLRDPLFVGGEPF